MGSKQIIVNGKKYNYWCGDCLKLEEQCLECLLHKYALQKLDEGRKVKGTMIKTVVRIMRSSRNRTYKKKLSASAAELYGKRISDEKWYQFDQYKECFDALCEVEGNNDPTTIMLWGKAYGESIMSSIYKSLAAASNLDDAIYGYSQFQRMVFSFGEVETTIMAGYGLKVTYRGFEPGWKNFEYISAGWTWKYFELCAGTKMSCRIAKYSTAADNSTEIILSW